MVGEKNQIEVLFFCFTPIFWQIFSLHLVFFCKIFFSQKNIFLHQNDGCYQISFCQIEINVGSAGNIFVKVDWPISFDQLSFLFFLFGEDFAYFSKLW